MARKPPPQLVVEGEDDLHVIRNLWCLHGQPDVFNIEKAKGDGIAALLDGLPILLRREGLQALGVVIDADEDVQARWQAVRDRLRKAWYNIPDEPVEGGWISDAGDRSPRVGVWVMPDNRLPGMLEDFVEHLIPAGDELHPRAEACLDDLEAAGVQRYALRHHTKALIHTWLAWQEAPGRPMGQAITQRVLDSNAPLAQTFVAWLKALFVEV
jgi:hypothetical protein